MTITRRQPVAHYFTDQALDEMEAQLDDTVPFYVPALLSEIRRLRKALFQAAMVSLEGYTPKEPKKERTHAAR